MTECRVCSKPFDKDRMGQVVCGVACAQKLPVINRKAERAKAKEERAKDRKTREAQKTWPKLNSEAQDAFNDWIRARDADKPCICCGGFPQSGALKGGEWDAGHYRSRGACKELRFDERNCHKQLKRCNQRAWDVAGYRANLVDRIGEAAVIDLEGPTTFKKYSRDDLRAIRDEYRARVKELQKGSM